MKRSYKNKLRDERVKVKSWYGVWGRGRFTKFFLFPSTCDS